MDARIKGDIGDTLLLLEHEPVVTLGRGAKREHILLSPDELRARGFDVVDTGRGGDVTYHGPGQLVGYPIVDLRPDRCDVRKYVGDLMNVMKQLAADHAISTGSIAAHPGIWVDLQNPHEWPGEQAAVQPAKLGAVGVRITHWVTMHGFAFNAQTQMEGFGVIVPCGIQSMGVTSLAQLVHPAPSPEQLAPRAAQLLSQLLQRDLDAFESVRVPDEDLASSILGTA